MVNGRIDKLRDEMNERFDEVDSRFEDTHDLIKFSHSELDKRIRILERDARKLKRAEPHRAPNPGIPLALFTFCSLTSRRRCP